MLNYKKDDFLARWLAGEISDKEKEAFEKSEDYLAFKDILNGVDRFDQLTFDTEKNLIAQKAYNLTYQDKKSKIISLKQWMYAAAALILIIISVRVFIPKHTTITTDMAQKETFTLPDKSQVVLNADSSIKYLSDSFLETRELTLEGQAYFKVAKGSKFTVKTENGKISVLGTEFDVYTRAKRLEVQCFEGKVRVADKTDEVILTKGKAVKSSSTKDLMIFDIQAQKPSWLDGITQFKETSLKDVISELERQFNVTIKSKDIDVQRKFTGFFAHKDIKKALQTCFDPMNINYTFINDNTIELRNK